MNLTDQKIKEIENLSRAALLAESATNKNMTPSVQSLVVRQLIATLSDTRSMALSDQNVRKISRNLSAKGNLSYQTYINWKTFNFLRDKLVEKKIIKCPPIEVPNETRKFLLFKPEDRIFRDLTYIQGLHDHLLKFREFETEDKSLSQKVPITNSAEISLEHSLWSDFNSTVPAPPMYDKLELAQKRKRWRRNLKDREIEYLCSFVAAAAIFGKILFDEYYKWLIQLNPDDIYLKPCYINRTFPNSNAIRRYFLPAPAAVYLLRCMRFYERNTNRMNNVRSELGRYWVADPEGILRNFGKDFKRWTASKLKHLDCKGLSLTEFRSAVIESSQIDLSDRHAIHNAYPPFLISIQSDQIESHSYGNLHFPYFMAVTPDRIDYQDRRPFDRRAYEFRKSKIATAIAKITEIRRSLMNPDMHYIAKRKKVIADIEAELPKSNLEPESGDYRNLRLYISWLSHTILHSTVEFSSMNTIAGLVPSLLYRMIGIGALDKLSGPDLVQVIRQTMFEYDSPLIKSALKDFCVYHEKVIGAPFTEINWAAKTLSKERIKSMKSFIQFDQLNLAISLTEDFFCSHAERMRVADKRRQKREIATHKARVIELAIQLAYYTGMRVSEIMKIRLRHIKNNRFLTIYRTKTDNGRRNIPFFMLCPISVSKELIAYYQKRKNQVKSLDELLFVQHNGKKWNPSQISRDVAKLFSAIGVRDFHFHHLRHTAANIYLFRVFAIYYPEIIPTDALMFKHELFEDGLRMFKVMLQGISKQREGDDAVDFALHILAHLMGHGGPQVTIQEYVHCSDILFYFMSLRHNNDTVPSSIRQMMDFLQCTHKQIPTEAYTQSISGEIKLGQLIHYQCDFTNKS